MKKVMAAGFCVLLLSGCLQMETKVKVDKQGAGTIEQTVVMRADMLAMMKGMQAADPSKKDAGLIDEKKLRESAGKMGAGVRFVSVTPIKNDMGEGYKAVYAFDDINKVSVSQSPGEALPQAGMSGQQNEGNEEIVSFTFKKGNPANLTIKLNRKDAGEKGAKPQKQEEGEKPEKPDMDPAMLEQFYRDMRLSMSLDVAGTIVETNADHRKGSTIVIMDLDLNALLKDKGAIDTLMKGQVDSIEGMKAFTKKYPAIKLETKEQIQVRFR